MNYFADGFTGGFAIGANARERKKDREEREKLEAARRALELDRDLKRQDFERGMQNDRLVADAKRLFDTQGFQGTQNQFDRDARARLQGDAQTFQSGQAALEREARAAALDKDIGFRGKVHADDLALKGAQVGNQLRHQAWLESPDNPYNTIRDAQSEKLRAEAQDLGGVAPVGGQFTKSAPPAQAIDHLRKNPQLAREFDLKYGQGAAARYLAQ